MDPSVLQEELLQEIKEEYGMTLSVNWTEQELYKKVYRAYLTELKHLVRIIDKKGDAK